MPFPNHSNVVTLPEELILKIIGYFSPPEILALKGKLPERYWNAPVIWKETCERHFPHAIDKLTWQLAIDWQRAFFDLHKTEYEPLDQRGKDLFYLLKEGQIDAVMNVIQLDDFQHEDSRNNNLSDWARRLNCQPLLDAFFQLRVHSNTPAPDIHIEAKYPVTYKVFLAILHRQRAYIKSLWESKDETELKAFFDEGALIYTSPLNRRNNPLLAFAALAGDLELFTYFMEQGINPDICWGDLGTPAFIAVQKGYLDILQYLAHQGVNILVCEYGMQTLSLLTVAVGMGHSQITRFLLANKAVVDEWNMERNSNALLDAARKGEPGVVLALLDHGANINISNPFTRDDQGVNPTALYLAAERGRADVVNILLARNADPLQETTFFKLPKHKLLCLAAQASPLQHDPDVDFFFEVTPWQIAHIKLRFEVIDCMRAHDLTPAQLDKTCYEYLLRLAKNISSSTSGFFSKQSRHYQQTVESMLVLYACHGHIDPTLVPGASRYPGLRAVLETIQGFDDARVRDDVLVKEYN